MVSVGHGECECAGVDEVIGLLRCHTVGSTTEAHAVAVVGEPVFEFLCGM